MKNHDGSQVRVITIDHHYCNHGNVFSRALVVFVSEGGGTSGKGTSLFPAAVSGRSGHSHGQERGSCYKCRCSKISLLLCEVSPVPVSLLHAVFLGTDWRLFCVRGELPEEGLLLEVECCCAGLRSRGSVVLLNSQQGVLYLWNGCKAHSSTKEVSKRTVERLTQM